MVGPTATTLGVRVPPDLRPDISPNADGVVGPGGGGMSVAPSWRQLPTHRIPARLKDKVPEATGSNQCHCWRMGEGLFLPGEMSADLRLLPDPGVSPRHGVVEPARDMQVPNYQGALAATREQWEIDEE